MDTPEEHLLEMLISLRTAQPVVSYGICPNITYFASDMNQGSEIEELLSALLEKLHPGNVAPIEGLKYYSTEAHENRWNPDHPWGAARFALLEALIAECQALVDKQKTPCAGGLR